ncbi:hypothetical protein BJP36_14330 [Moorena producens JHB]|uniref:Uncharacterized protein n=1 Tax=Moorena producens (strain JHB) TaxID=1454205 RepID=A0A1D9FZW8_MOOP1|nr:hypothetical protein [Moorena producens]AOY80906.1 hypothetical protein BJP36_14330 [Moorena producens JHB]
MGRIEKKKEANPNIRQLLTERLAQADIISLEVESPNNEHPWMEFSGMYANNPLFDEVLADIAAYRDEIDAEIEGKCDSLKETLRER